MRLPARLLLIAAVLGATLAVQLGLLWHVRGRAELEYAHLRQPLMQLPLNFSASADPTNPARFGPWIGRTNEGAETQIRAQLPFQPEELLSRTYVKSDMTVGLNLYLVHSRQGLDRRHHPEVCVRDVTGATEDLTARTILFVDAEGKRPIQRFRFRTEAAHAVTMYYWHYALPRVPHAGETGLQVLYQRMNQPAPSITVQVSLAADPAQLEAVEKGFLVSLDQALRTQYLPEGAVIACDRLPVLLQRRN